MISDDRLKRLKAEEKGLFEELEERRKELVELNKLLIDVSAERISLNREIDSLKARIQKILKATKSCYSEETKKEISEIKRKQAPLKRRVGNRNRCFNRLQKRKTELNDIILFLREQLDTIESEFDQEIVNCFGEWGAITKSESMEKPNFIDIYFGGAKERGGGFGHGHAILSSEGEIIYLRTPLPDNKVSIEKIVHHDYGQKGYRKKHQSIPRKITVLWPAYVENKPAL